MFKKTFLSILLTFLFISPIYAYSDYLMVGGENIGITLKSKGVVIVGFYKVDNKYIAKESGLELGDIIIEVNGKVINSINDLTSSIRNNDNISITYLRDSNTRTTNLKLLNNKTGIYVKDSITGIGTLTYVDPNTKLFGALGHEIIDSRTGQLFNIKTGNIYDSDVTNIEPSSNGVPGEKNARISTTSIGTVLENTNKGIFGNYSNIKDSKLYKVAKPNEIKKGEATIYTVLNEKDIKGYTIKINKLNDSKDTKNILFEIIDEELLSKTNGIIQGMSGSPIVQGEYIIGAVTHVIVDNPHKGYGIFITNMLEESEN